MKIHECEDQLKKLTDSYFSIKQDYKQIIDIIININKDNITIKNVYDILSYISYIRRYLPIDILKEIESYFDPFDISDIDEIESHIIRVEEIFNNEDKVFNSRFYDELHAIERIRNEKNHFNRICELFRFLNRYVYPKSVDLVNANVDEVFKACMKAKNKIWEYTLSLELPTETDNEIEMRKVNERYGY